MTLSNQMVLSPQALMFDLGVVVKYLGFASEAARTNWYGFGCRVFCYQPPVSLFIRTAVLSFILGIVATTYTFWILCSGSPPLAASASPVVNRYSALAGYLHERRSSSRRRSN